MTLLPIYISTSSHVHNTTSVTFAPRPSIEHQATPSFKTSTSLHSNLDLPVKASKKFLVAAILLIASFTYSNKSSAQYVGIEVVVDTVLYGNYWDLFLNDSIDLTGFIVYEIYACVADPADCVTGMVGGLNDAANDLDCMNAGDNDNLLMTFTGDVFNNEAGGILGQNINCALCVIAPTLCWDSYVTAGTDCNTDGGTVNYIQLPCEGSEWSQTFTGTIPGDYTEPGNDLYIDNGGWFAFPSGFDPNTIAGSDLKVLLAQITTNGDFTLEGYVTLQEDCLLGNPIIPNLIDFNYTNPCETFALDTLINAFLPDCDGDAVGITVEDGGNGWVNYQLHDCITDALLETSNADPDGWTILNLSDGNYYVTMIDSIGCRDTSNCVTITIPEPLQFNAQISQDILCFGNSNGSITTSCTGGALPVDVIYAGPLSGSVQCGQTISGLITGTYNLIATDALGCFLDTTITLANPAQLNITISETDVDCSNAQNGALTGTVSGGSGDIAAEWTGLVNQTFIGPSILTITLANLNGGSYTITATDTNNCILSEDYEVLEPDGLELTVVHSDASCFGVCDGEVTATTEGGTNPIDITITGSDFEDLCPDIYIIIATDGNNCSMTDTVEVTSPTQITYEDSFTILSCFGACDGVIDIQNINGSCGDYQYAISPAAGTAVETANSVTYSALCPGTYDVEITDPCGCGVTINDVLITEPAELLVQTVTEQITCYGYDNGSIDVTSTGSASIVEIIAPEAGTLPFTLDSLAPGTYHIVIENESGCQDSTDLIITEPGEFITAVTASTPVGCGGDCDATISVEYTGGTSPFSYELLDATDSTTVVDSGSLTDGGTDVIDGVCAGDWLVVLLDDNNCASDTIPVTIAQPDPIIINVTEDWITCTGMCDGSAAILFSGGTGELTAQFFPEELDPNCGIGSCTLVDLCEGVYSVTVTDEDNCEMDTTIVIGAEIVTDMILSLFSSPETCWNEMDGTVTVAVTNGSLPINYSWSDPLEQITATAVGLVSNEVYTVTVTDAIGCTLTEQIEVEPTIGCFFIATALTPNGDGVNDYWLLGGLEYFPESEVQVFNRWGQVMFESRGYQAPWDGTFKGNNLPVADYYFVINYSDEADPIMGTVTIKY